MGDDVVELAPVAVVAQVGLLQPHGLQPEVRGRLRAELRRHEVEPDRLEPGHVRGHRDEVHPVRAPDLEHARAAGRRRLEPVEDAEDGEPVRVRLRDREPGVRDLLVGRRVAHPADTTGGAVGGAEAARARPCAPGTVRSVTVRVAQPR